MERKRMFTFLLFLAGVLFGLCDAYTQICGTDDRVPSNDPAVGRLRRSFAQPVTAFILPTGKLITAGHVFTQGGTERWVEFNVPLSTSGGVVVDSAPEDRYLIINSSIVFNSDITNGNDWAVFEVSANSETGLLPIQAQNVSYSVARGRTPSTVTVTGYGLAQGPLNYTQQTHTDEFSHYDGYKLWYYTDVQSGCSGGPAIDESGIVVGVQSYGGCPNYATSVNNPAFWDAMGVKEVAIDQVLSNNTPVGTIARWMGLEFSSRFSAGTILSPGLDAYDVYQADTVIHQNEKYIRWNNESEVENYHEFYIDENADRFTANFLPTYSNIAVNTNLIDVSGTSSGNIQFRDPWYIDYRDPDYGNTPRNQGMDDAEWHERAVGTEGFKPDYSTQYDGGRLYRGVFLNQDPQLTPTFYSVGAPNPQPITVNGQTFDWYFQNWEGTNVQYQNASASPGIVFTSAGATATAKYKAHRGSSLATAAAPSSQRKLVNWGVGYHHLVYQSAGNIWYVKSTNDGASWSQEERVSPASEGNQNSNPAIDVDGLGNVFVVYEAPFLSNRAIVVKKRLSSGTWDPLRSESFLASSELKPVIAVSKETTSPKVVVVVQANGYGSSTDPGLYHVQVLSPAAVGKVTETSASSLNPTLAYANLAYQESNVIYRKSITYTNPIVIGSRETVSTNYFNGRPLSNISNPNIAVREGGGLDYNSRPVIAWQATDLVFSTYRPIFVRHPVSGGIPPVFVLTVFDWATSNAHGKTPSVNVYQTPAKSGYQNPDVSVVWQDDPTDANGTYPNVVAANKISGYWYAQSTIATSSASSSVAQGDVSQTSSGGALIVRAGSSGPPYALMASERTNYGQIEDGLMAKTNATSMSYARSVNVDLAGTGINGLSGVLSLYIRNAPRFGLRHLRELPSVQEDFLRLQAQSPIADEISYVLSLCDVTIPNGIGNEQLRQRICALQVSLNGRDFQTLGAITVKDLSALWNTRTSDTIRVIQRERAFSVPAVGHVRFSVEPLFFNNPDHVVLIEEITLQDTSSTRLAKSASHEVLPQAFFLHPNHPNPFNPSTTISFDVPEASHVSLVVYDVLGRQVAGLVNGSYEAGYHSVPWNASSFASGIYLARFTATDASGAVKLSTTQKLVLAK